MGKVQPAVHRERRRTVDWTCWTCATTPRRKVYEAPFQLKANNGIYLIDDFGRQRATPAEVLNRWIVPMERRVDYLSFLTGGKMTVPFETFLVFSTNLNPADLGDEAFLRRIQYKMLLRGPAENEFIKIFETFCASRKLPYSRDLITRFIDRHYRQTGKAFRRCHPRDVLSHAINLIDFEKLPYALNDELLDRAFECCFFEDDESQPEIAVPAPQPAAAPQPEADQRPLLPLLAASCADYWGDKLAEITTAFGSLAFVASRRKQTTGVYGSDAESARHYSEADTARVLARLHIKTFAEWLSMKLDQQARDLGRYLAGTQENAARLTFEKNVLVSWLTPPEARPEEIELFSSHLSIVLRQVCPPAPEVLAPAPASQLSSVECAA